MMRQMVTMIGALMWITRLLLVPVAIIDVYVAYRIGAVWIKHGSAGLRDFISFAHTWPEWPSKISEEELIRQVQKGYESFALLLLVLTVLTCILVYAHRSLVRLRSRT